MRRTVGVVLFTLLAIVPCPPAHAAGPFIWTVAGSGAPPTAATADRPRRPA
jgi:hypothetical protein